MPPGSACSGPGIANPEGLVADIVTGAEVPHAFFTVPPASLAPVTFRKKASASVRDERRVKAEIRDAARVFEVVSREAGFHESRLPRPEDSAGDVGLLAEQVRHRAGLGADEPVSVAGERSRLWEQCYRQVFPDTCSRDVADELGVRYALLDHWIDDVPGASDAAATVVSLADWRGRR